MYSFLNLQFLLFFKRFFFSLPPRKHVLSSTLLYISIIPRLLCNAEMSSFLAKKLFIEEFFSFHLSQLHSWASSPFKLTELEFCLFLFYKQISQTWTTHNQETCMCGGILEIETILKNNYVCSPQRLLHLELGERTRFLITTVKESFRFCFLYLYFSLV